MEMEMEMGYNAFVRSVIRFVYVSNTVRMESYNSVTRMDCMDRASGENGVGRERVYNKADEILRILISHEGLGDDFSGEISLTIHSGKVVRIRTTTTIWAPE